MDLTQPLLPEKSVAPNSGNEQNRAAEARRVAQEYEASFIAEMLKYTGVNSTSDTFGGGAGEDAFASFLTQEYATKIAEAGGLGIAETVFNAMMQEDRNE